MHISLTAVCAVVAAGWLAVGCDGHGSGGSTEAEPAKLGLPLKTYSSSGAEYRLRNADFQVWGYAQNCWSDPDCEAYDNNISSEDYLEEDSIVLDLIAGDYEIFLQQGWQLEKTEDGVTEIVEATLLNDPYQWLWVSPHSTTWVSYQFGVGGTEIWLNGQVTINIDVYEDPDEYYGWGTGGSTATGGSWGTGGSTGPQQGLGGGLWAMGGAYTQPGAGGSTSFP